MSTYSNCPAVSGVSELHTLTGVWNKARDQIPMPPNFVQVVAHLEPSTPNFDSTMPHATYVARPESLHVIPGNSSLQVHRTPSYATSPPPYAPYDCEVAYSVEEPPTLARMLFMYGFLFFPFWIAGICIFWSPLVPPPGWESEKTEDEKIRLLRVLRETELVWAKRCLYALCGLLATTSITVILIKCTIMG